MAETLHGNKHIVYLGETGFPHGLAPIQRQLLISLGLVKSGANVLVISNKGVHNPDKTFNLAPYGSFQGIDYIYTSGEIYRRHNFTIRNFLKIKGLLREFQLLLNLKKHKKVDAAIVATMRFQSILYYFILSRLLSFRMLLNYVECNHAISTRTKLRDRINDYLIDRLGLCYSDAILPISDYLKQHAAKICPQKPQLKIPIVGDFTGTPLSIPATPRYFLYCGSASYLELIEFIIQSFELLESPDIFLYLVVSGDALDMEKFRLLIKSSVKRDFIKIYSGISFKELQKKYCESVGLLIPLRKSVQDIARFPHKIGEYLASGVPIITTKIGEIAHYFKDDENAIICNDFEPKEYATKLQFVLDHPHEAQEIGRKGLELGRLKFDYQKQGSALLRFIDSLQ